MKSKQLFGDTDGIRAKANTYPLDPKTLIRLGKALAQYAKRGGKKRKAYKILIGQDTRESSENIVKNLRSGILSQGVDVHLMGILTTPALSFLTKSDNYDLGVMVTASHNPYTDNGVKVFKSNGSKTDDKEELEIERIYFRNNFQGRNHGKSVTLKDSERRYSNVLKNIIGELDLKGLNIVLDTANGAASSIAPKIFKQLGAKVITISNKPNGKNINKDCGVLFPNKLIDKVKKTKASLGIAFDGDADRVILVDERGNFIDGDYIMALISTDLKEKGQLKNSGIVATSYSNLALDKYLQKKGIKVERVVNGDKYVAQLCKKRKYSFGGEQSGHFIFMDISTTGDGILTALKALQIMKEKNKTLSEIAYVYDKNPQKQYNIPVIEKKPIEELSAFTYELKKWEERIKDTGRIFTRYSGTQNIFRIVVEHEDEEIVKTAGAYLSELIYSLIGDPDENYYVANE